MYASDKQKKLLKVRKLLKFLAGCAVAVTMLTFTVFAADFENPAESAYDGFLIQMKGELQDGVQLFSDDENELEQVFDNIYWTDSEELAQQMQKSGDAEFVEPNYYVELFDENGSTWSNELIHTEAASALGLDGSGIRIGLIDSGIDLSNADLQQANILTGYDYVLGTEEMCDTVYHGTKVAQVIAGADNGVGLTGIAPQAELVPLRCFDASTGGTVKMLSQAIMDAVDVYGCNVINMSWGLKTNSATLYAAVSHAAENNVTMVAAVGNISSSYPSGTIVYPAGYDEVVGVSSVDASEICAATSMRSAAVSVCAPGAGLTFVGADGEETTSSGTSFASPAVSAVCALLLQNQAELSAEAIRTLLVSKAVDLGDEGWDDAYGYGLVDLSVLLPSESDDSLRIVTQPDGGEATLGQKVTISFEAANAAYYQWYYSRDGGENWNKLYFDGAKTDSLSVTYTASRSQYIYMCLVTGFDGTQLYTEPTSILQGTEPDGVITRQPESISADVGETVSFSIAADNAVSYQWNYSSDNGTTWKKLYWEGAKSDTLTFAVKKSRYSYIFCCVITDGNGKACYSNTCFLCTPSS